MNSLFLIDLAPDPAPASCLGMIVLGIIVLLIAAAMIGGLVFLLVRRKRRNALTATVAAANAPQRRT
jgi:hypothetical protein